MIIHYKIHELLPYVNWVFFYFAWSLKAKYAAVAEVLTTHDCPACRENWINSFATPEEQNEAREAMRLYLDAQDRLRQLELDGVMAHCLFELLPAYSEGDNIWVTRADGSSLCLPFLRQQHTQTERPNLCLSDFIAPKGYNDPSRTADCIGGFSTTVDDVADLEDPYERMLIQTLLDRLAEAAAEKLHQAVRTEYWGYVPDEKLTKAELLAEKYQGIRPAVGYPSIPDQSFNFLLYELIPMREIGVTLTENGMMAPHASVSGLMFAHPQAHYFAIGAVSDEQLTDYAARRGTTLEKMRKFVPKS